MAEGYRLDWHDFRQAPRVFFEKLWGKTGSSDNAVENQLSDFIAVTPVRVECLGF
jgi:hypothetical protein